MSTAWCSPSSGGRLFRGYLSHQGLQMRFLRVGKKRFRKLTQKRTVWHLLKTSWLVTRWFLYHNLSTWKLNVLWASIRFFAPQMLFRKPQVLLWGGGGEGCAPPAPTPKIPPGYKAFFIFNCFLSIAYINLPLSFIWCKENNYRLQITNGKPSRSMRETDKKIHGAK